MAWGLAGRGLASAHVRASRAQLRHAQVGVLESESKAVPSGSVVW
jgi:hypothetical protein